MRVENLFHETTMSENPKGGDGPQTNDGLSYNQQLKFHTLVGYAGELEKEINALIAEFEQKHRVSCWVSSVKHNEISIDIASETDGL